MRFRNVPGPFLLILALGAGLPPAAAGGFVATGTMVTARQKAVATPLADGRVLITGGRISPAAASKTRKAELYDPAAGTFTATGDMLTARQDHTAVRLADGRVLVFNGGDLFAPLNDVPPTLAELYDPVTGTFTATAAPLVERDLASATLLADGRVIVAGGRGCNPCADLGGGVFTLRDTDVVELYDPATGQFVAAGTLSSSRGLATVTALVDGGAVVIGGNREEFIDDGGAVTIVNHPLATAERFDPVTGALVPLAGTMATARAGHAAAALADGRVLVAYGALDAQQTLVPAAVEVLDPAAGTFTAVGTPVPDRPIFGLAVTLAGGSVLFAGGDGGLAASADVYDVAGGTLAGGLPMLRKHLYHVVAPLPDGRALVAGGLDPDNPPVPRGGAQLYDPDLVPDPLFADDFEAPPVHRVAAESGAPAGSDCPFALPAAVRRGASGVVERLLVRTADGRICSVHYVPES